MRVQVPRIAAGSPEMVHSTRERYVPITSPVQTDLLDIVRNRLRPTPEPPTPPTGAARSRAELHTALLHRPQGRDSGTGL